MDLSDLGHYSPIQKAVLVWRVGNREEYESKGEILHDVELNQSTKHLENFCSVQSSVLSNKHNSSIIYNLVEKYMCSKRYLIIKGK